MMKKIILLCLLVIGLLLVGCTTENVNEDEIQDITEEDLAELPEDVKTDLVGDNIEDFEEDTFSGQVSSLIPIEVTFSSTSLIQGAELDIKVTAGKYYTRGRIYKSDHQYGVPLAQIKLCPSGTCYAATNVKYEIPSAWSGDYVFKVYDFTDKGWEDVNFNVVSNSSQTEPVYKDSTFTYEPSIVKEGDYLNLNVEAGTNGYYKHLYFRKGNSYLNSVNLCEGASGYICYDNAVLNYQIPSTFEPGTYYAYTWGILENKGWKTEIFKFKVESSSLCSDYDLTIGSHIECDGNVAVTTVCDGSKVFTQNCSNNNEAWKVNPDYEKSCLVNTKGRAYCRESCTPGETVHMCAENNVSEPYFKELTCTNPDSQTTVSWVPTSPGDETPQECTENCFDPFNYGCDVTETPICTESELLKGKHQECDGNVLVTTTCDGSKTFTQDCSDESKSWLVNSEYKNNCFISNYERGYCRESCTSGETVHLCSLNNESQPYYQEVVCTNPETDTSVSWVPTSPGNETPQECTENCFDPLNYGCN